jgi:Domain of unknown function (DUF397)
MRPNNFARLMRRSSSYYRDRGVCTADLSNASWRKSSYSAANGNCVDVAWLRPGQIGVRDTKDREQGPVLIFTQREWKIFLAGVRVGKFNSI